MISTNTSHRRPLSVRACLLVFCCVLSFATFAAPVAVRAQASGEQPVASSPAKAEKKTEAEELNVYRHSASVQWFAKLLHIDVETAATSFEYINFAIIALAIAIPLFKMLPKVFRQRSARLGAELEVAQAKTADANERLSVVEAKMAGLDAEIAAIRKQVEEEMRADETRHKAAIEEETARIVAVAEHEIVMAGSQAQRGLKKFAADLAIDRALSTLTLDAEADRALIAEFAADFNGGKRASKGDKN